MSVVRPSFAKKLGEQLAKERKGAPLPRSYEKIYFEPNDPIVELANDVLNNSFPKGKRIDSQSVNLHAFLVALRGGNPPDPQPHILVRNLKENINKLKEMNETIQAPLFAELIELLEEVRPQKVGGRRRCAATRKRSQRKRKATRRR